MRNLAILGSTGSIGVQTLDVARTHPDRLRVAALAGGRNAALLIEPACEFGCEVGAVADGAAGAVVARSLRDVCEVRVGPAAVESLGDLDSVDTHVVAITGFAGLRPMLRALRRGRRVCFATKEPLVAAGDLVLAEASESGALLAPIDSEISALWQCLGGSGASDGHRRLLTGSGGPFREWSAERIEDASIEDALAHPTWSMGAKITVDSASLMNKGLEVIEAMRFFGVPLETVQVVIHPQSVVHSMVEFDDGSVLAQLGRPDMRLPIQYAILRPDRPPNAFDRIDWLHAGALTFEEPDTERFPCLRLAYEAARAGGTAPTVLNAANEVANAAFLSGGVPFGAIARAVEFALAAHRPSIPASLADVEDADSEGRALAARYIAEASR